MDDRSVPKIRPVIIPRHRWNEVAELVRLTQQALGIAERKNATGLEVTSGCVELLSKKVSAISWRAADDLEDWEKENEDDESFEFDGEACIVEVRLSEEDRRAIANLLAAVDSSARAGPSKPSGPRGFCFISFRCPARPAASPAPLCEAAPAS